MSMITNFRRLPNRDLQRLLAEPALVTEYLHMADSIEDDEERFGLFVNMDVDKAWHGIHFLLTGSAEPADLPEGFICTGGRPMGHDDVGLGYGPARGFTSSEVKQIAGMLAAADEAKLRSRFDPHVMTRDAVYPGDWAEGDAFGGLIHFYTPLREFHHGRCAGG